MGCDVPCTAVRWPEDEEPEGDCWGGVTMEDSRVVELELDDFGITDAVLAGLGQLTSLERLDLNSNQLTSVLAEIGQLTSLHTLELNGNQHSVPGDIGQLVADEFGPRRQSADERAGGDRAARVAEGWNEQPADGVPAEIGRSRRWMCWAQRQSADERAGGDRADHVAIWENRRQQADECARGDRAARLVDEVGPQRQSADEHASGDRAAHIAGSCTSTAIS